MALFTEMLAIVKRGIRREELDLITESKRLTEETRGWTVTGRRILDQVRDEAARQYQTGHVWEDTVTGARRKRPLR